MKDLVEEARYGITRGHYNRINLMKSDSNVKVPPQKMQPDYYKFLCFSRLHRSENLHDYMVTMLKTLDITKKKYNRKKVLLKADKFHKTAQEVKIFCMKN